MKRFTLLMVLSSIVCFSTPVYSQSTAAENVLLLDEAFPMPALGGRTRSIWVYLPPDYDTEASKRYPVFYMQDGRNLFDAEIAYRKTEWQVDESLNALTAEGKTDGVIVVGIDHGNEFRDDEYVPWQKENGQGGEGDAYVDFLINTLKPYIDDNFRTLTDRAHTGIGGGSLGGYIALYAAIRNPEVFGGAAVLSPAFWFQPEIMNYISSTAWSKDIRIYMVTSQEEGETSVGYFHEAYQRLRESGHGYRLIRKKLTPTGGHDEMYYRQQFPEAFLWMFEPQYLTTGLEGLSPAQAGLVAYPNPTSDLLNVQLPEGWHGKAEAYIIDALGRRRTQPARLKAYEAFSIAALPAGMYYLIVTSEQRRIALPVVKN